MDVEWSPRWIAVKEAGAGPCACCAPLCVEVQENHASICSCVLHRASGESQEVGGCGASGTGWCWTFTADLSFLWSAESCGHRAVFRKIK